jgi:WD40 repeat protein
MRKTGILLFLIIVNQAFGQREKGTWQDYLSYTNAIKLAIADNKIYCASVGGLFYLDTDDNSINKVTTNDGLSDFGIQTVAWSKEKKVLVVAYKNSNIDLIYENGIFNLSDIKRKQMTADKTVNNIAFIGSEAFLACSFGIVVVNLDKKEVKATWFIGENGSQVRVNDFETDGVYFYAATDKGILKAEKNNANLLDFNNWKRIEDIPNNTERFNNLVIHDGKLIANYNQPDKYDSDELYMFNGTLWSRYLS